MNAANLVTTEADNARREPYSLRAFLLYFLRLGALGFGGPIALLLLLRVKKLPELLLILGAAMIGTAVKAIPR